MSYKYDDAGGTADIDSLYDLVEIRRLSLNRHGLSDAK